MPEPEPPEWSPSLTRGLWGTIQAAVREGIPFHQVGEAARAAGERPDAATIAHLYSRAVGGLSVARQEADYASRVDRNTYLGRRPSGQLVAVLPRGFSLAARWRQVIKVSGIGLDGKPRTDYVNVQQDRLLSRGEAIEAGVAALRETRGGLYLSIDEADYESTWTSE